MRQGSLLLLSDKLVLPGVCTLRNEKLPGNTGKRERKGELGKKARYLKGSYLEGKHYQEHY